MDNPLLAQWDTPFGIPPFDRISDDDFGPALDAAIAESRAAARSIATNADPTDFANTIEAFELADTTLNRVLGVFFNLAGADSNSKREELQREFSPKLARHFSEIAMDGELFARIETLWRARDELDLTEEQDRLLFLVRRSFVRSGAALEGKSRERLARAKERLAELGTRFAQNLLADERDWRMDLAEEDLEGLPDFAVDAMRSAGEEKGAEGPAVTLSRSLIEPFLRFSPRRDLREKAYRAWTSRGANGGETDNRAIAAEILKLRQEAAELLGYPNYAAFKLETEMAGTSGAVSELLMSVWEPARKTALADAGRLAGMLRADGIDDELEPWDWRYYAEKRRSAEHDIDESELKPYLQLERMIEAAFACARRLFGLEFRPLDLTLHHPDALAWEATRKGRHVAVFVGDYLARSSKRSGAWCSTYRRQRKLAGEVRPVVVNICNFAKPSAGRPTLLSLDDARTLFHEFGHALHCMLSDVVHEAVSGTSVARDFVELPSQLFERWLEAPGVLDEFAVHAETGEAMPRDTLDRALGAANFDIGFQTAEYIASALVDLAFHDGPAPADPMARQAETLEAMGMPRAIGMRHAAPHFAHVFAGDGYSSGYYSYMWSEVMAADAFEAFRETGDLFDPATAARLEECILSRGGTEEAGTLYEKFRGRMPEVEALLKARGLVAAA